MALQTSPGHGVRVRPILYFSTFEPLSNNPETYVLVGEEDCRAPPPIQGSEDGNGSDELSPLSSHPSPLGSPRTFSHQSGIAGENLTLAQELAQIGELSPLRSTLMLPALSDASMHTQSLQVSTSALTIDLFVDDQGSLSALSFITAPLLSLMVRC